VAGGFHLVAAKDEEINRVASSLKDTYKVAYIAPGHCTGEPTFNALQKIFGNSYLYAGVGTTLDQAALSSSPTASSASSKQPVAMNQKTWISTGNYLPEAMTMSMAPPLIQAILINNQ
jgi:hypothetical protein